MFKIRFYRKYTVSIERLILDLATLRAPRREEATISSRVKKHRVVPPALELKILNRPASVIFISPLETLKSRPDGVCGHFHRAFLDDARRRRARSNKRNG